MNWFDLDSNNMLSKSSHKKKEVLRTKEGTLWFSGLRPETTPFSSLLGSALSLPFFAAGGSLVPRSGLLEHCFSTTESLEGSTNATSQVPA